MRRFLEKWKDELPGVAGTLTGAFIVFVASIVAYRFKDVLWPGKDIDYPLICRSEPVANENGKMTVEFYVINTTDKGYFEPELSKILNNSSAGTTLLTDPAIELEPTRDFTQLEAAEDAVFNKNKGRLIVITAGKNVVIRIDEIRARAILRANLEVSGLAITGEVNRGAKGNIPFNTDDYEDACYQRT